ncbi:hypothetical protein FZEAL_3548 [Fusarium zealandicum]|uniref:Uncharacterized protein n=1 Tax=Fusarium zealandicum TaxID=1053134 RepID=A0A8H4UP00_9HYPO|nr:hypothetical protein FZEAL_3548 [Fusarium zealandicum]
MSSVTTSAAATANTACTNLYDTPNQDTVCAMPYKNNYVDMMKECCGDAKVVSYYNDCGLYCVALDQTTEDLSNCLWDQGALDQDVFCSNKTANASKTKDADVPASAQATVLSGDDADDTKDDKDADKDDKDSNNDKDSDDSNDSDATGTADSSTASNTDSAAPGLAPQSSISTLGLALGALLFSSMAVGAFQV